MLFAAILGAVFGGIAAAGSIASGIIGTKGARAQQAQAKAQGIIGARQRRSQGAVEIGEMEFALAASGVGVADRRGGGSPTLTEGKIGFFGKEKKVGGLVKGRMDRTGQTDTAGLILDLSEEAITLDAEAIRINAKNLSDAYRMTALSKTIGTIGGGIASIGGGLANMAFEADRPGADLTGGEKALFFFQGL